LSAALCRKTHDRRRRAPQILENCGVGRWRTCSRFALLCEIPCRIEKVRDNLGGGVFRQGSRGCYFGVRSTPRGVTTVQAGSMPSKSRKPREWPIHPKPDIPGRLPERLLRPRSRHSGSDARRSAKLNERRKLGRPIGARNGGNWVDHTISDTPDRSASALNRAARLGSASTRTALTTLSAPGGTRSPKNITASDEG